MKAAVECPPARRWSRMRRVQFECIAMCLLCIKTERGRGAPYTNTTLVRVHPSTLPPIQGTPMPILPSPIPSPTPPAMPPPKTPPVIPWSTPTIPQTPTSTHPSIYTWSCWWPQTATLSRRASLFILFYIVFILCFARAYIQELNKHFAQSKWYAGSHQRVVISPGIGPQGTADGILKTKDWILYWILYKRS